MRASTAGVSGGFHNTSLAYIRAKGKAPHPMGEDGHRRACSLPFGTWLPRSCEGARPTVSGRLPWDPSRRARRLGLTGSLLMAVGALGSGALPVPNPLFGLRVLGLPARNATLAIAVTYAGIGLMVLAWLWVGQDAALPGCGGARPDQAQLARTAVMWALPLAVAPPMFSRDVYSYLAQSAILARHLDPYVLGPAEALGVDDPLTRSIPTIWRDTPAPYGPLFLILGRGITAISGNDVVLGVLEHRALALCGRGDDRVGAAPAGQALRARRRAGAVARRGQPAGAVPPGQRHPQRVADDRAAAGRAGDRAALRAAAAGPASARRDRADRRLLGGQAAGAARAGLPRAGVGPAPRRALARRGRGGRADGRRSPCSSTRRCPWAPGSGWAGPGRWTPRR